MLFDLGLCANLNLIAIKGTSSCRSQIVNRTHLKAYFSSSWEVLRVPVWGFWVREYLSLWLIYSLSLISKQEMGSHIVFPWDFLCKEEESCTSKDSMIGKQSGHKEDKQVGGMAIHTSYQEYSSACVLLTCHHCDDKHDGKVIKEETRWGINFRDQSQ